MNPNSWISKIRSWLSLFEQDMQIENLEKKWLYVATAMVGFFVIILGIGAVVLNVNPPSHWETIDSASLHLSGEFAEDKLGIQSATLPDGTIQVKLVAARYGFYPREIVVPADQKIQFRMANLGRVAWCAHPDDQYEYDDCSRPCVRSDHRISQAWRIPPAVQRILRHGS